MNYENFICAVEGLANKFNSTNTEMYVHINHTDHCMEVSCLSRDEMRDRWIEQMLCEYEEEFIRFSNTILCDPEHKVMVVYFCDGWGSEGYGISKCSPNDDFDSKIGMAVAFAHFRGYEIPDFV